jgi:hypothetical protein
VSVTSPPTLPPGDDDDHLAGYDDDDDDDDDSDHATTTPATSIPRMASKPQRTGSVPVSAAVMPTESESVRELRLVVDGIVGNTTPAPARATTMTTLPRDESNGTHSPMPGRGRPLLNKNAAVRVLLCVTFCDVRCLCAHDAGQASRREKRQQGRASERSQHERVRLHAASLCSLVSVRVLF